MLRSSSRLPLPTSPPKRNPFLQTQEIKKQIRERDRALQQEERKEKIRIQERERERRERELIIRVDQERNKIGIPRKKEREEILRVDQERNKIRIQKKTEREERLRVAKENQKQAIKIEHGKETIGNSRKSHGLDSFSVDHTTTPVIATRVNRRQYLQTGQAQLSIGEKINISHLIRQTKLSPKINVEALAKESQLIYKEAKNLGIANMMKNSSDFNPKTKSGTGGVQLYDNSTNNNEHSNLVEQWDKAKRLLQQHSCTNTIELITDKSASESFDLKGAMRGLFEKFSVTLAVKLQAYLANAGKKHQDIKQWFQYILYRELIRSEDGQILIELQKNKWYTVQLLAGYKYAMSPAAMSLNHMAIHAKVEGGNLVRKEDSMHFTIVRDVGLKRKIASKP